MNFEFVVNLFFAHNILLSHITVRRNFITLMRAVRMLGMIYRLIMASDVCLQCFDTVGWASGEHPACKIE